MSLSSKQVTWRLVVHRELAGAVARHADPHEAKQDSHTQHHRALLGLQHGLRGLGLQERAGVTTTAAATHAPCTVITTGHDHCWGWWWWPRLRASHVPPASGCSGILKQVTLVTHLSYPSNGLTIREESRHRFHVCYVWVHSPLQVWGRVMILSQSRGSPTVRFEFSDFLRSSLLCLLLSSKKRTLGRLRVGVENFYQLSE